MSGKRDKATNPHGGGVDGERKHRDGREGSSSPVNANVSFASTTTQEADPDAMVAAPSFVQPERRQSRALDMHTILNPTPPPNVPSPSMSRRRSAAHLEDAEDSPSPKRPAYNPAPARAATMPRSTRNQFFEARQNPFPDDRTASTPVNTLSPIRSPTRSVSGAFAPFPRGPGAGESGPRRLAVPESPGSTFPTTPVPPLSRPPPSSTSSVNVSPVSSTATHISSMQHPQFPPGPPPQHDPLGMTPDSFGMAGYPPPPQFYVGLPAGAFGGAVALDGTPIQLFVDQSGAGSREMNKRREKNAFASKRFRIRKKVTDQTTRQENTELKHRLQEMEARLARRDEDIEQFRRMVDRNQWPRQPGDTPPPQPVPIDEQPTTAPVTRRRRMPARRGGSISTVETTPVTEPRQLTAGEGYFSGTAGPLAPINRSRQSSVSMSEEGRTPTLGPQGEMRHMGGGTYGTERDTRGYTYPLGGEHRQPSGGSQHPPPHGLLQHPQPPGGMPHPGPAAMPYPTGTRAEQRLGSLFSPVSFGGEGQPAPGGGVSLLPYPQHGISRAAHDPALTRSEAPALDPTRPILPPPSSGPPPPHYLPHPGPGRPH